MALLGNLYRRVLSLLSGDAGGVALINLVLAVLAFGKDLVQADFFGTSSSSDALTLAFFIPDTIGNNLLAFALGVACVPMFCKLLVQGDRKRLQRLLLQVTVYAVVVSLVLSVLLYFFSNQVLHAIGSGMEPDVFVLCRHILILLLPTIVLVPLCMIGSAALQAMGSFAPPAWGPVVFNACWFGAIVLLLFAHVDQVSGAMYTAGGILLGVVLMLVVIAGAIWKKRKQFWLSASSVTSNADAWRGVFSNHEDFKRVMAAFAPYLLILCCSQVIYTVERHVASDLGSGTISALTYAFRLAQFPNWVFIAALTTVLLPSLARALGANDQAQVHASWNRAVKATLLLTVPLSAGFCLLRVPLVSLLFKHGSFDGHSLQTTSDILAGYALSIVPVALTQVGLRYYMAVERMRVPTVIALVTLVVNSAFDLLVAPKWGPAALGYGAAGGAWVGACVMIVLVNGDLRKMGKLGGIYGGALSDHHSGV
ncbi:MAG: murein biosynthesis integral membrane protein MurJ [Tumebacillaceae bacterium]